MQKPDRETSWKTEKQMRGRCAYGSYESKFWGWKLDVIGSASCPTARCTEASGWAPLFTEQVSLCENKPLLYSFELVIKLFYDASQHQKLYSF